MQHIEFFHIDHFENNYYRVKPPESLSHFIDFFWETKFDHLWEIYPEGFSDALFPNIGYTYLINLGTPFTMQVADKFFDMKTDGFLPRNNAIECYHQKDNRLFGIKFKVSPVIYEKKINFSEYKGQIFPLSYLMEGAIIQQVKNAASFEDRLIILCKYFEKIVNKYQGSMLPVQVVTQVLDRCDIENDFSVSIKELAEQHNISSRTLQRYFETVTSLSSKKALQIMRIRKAVHHLATSPGNFDYALYGYYDHSHFYKHLKSFLQKDTLSALQPHLQLLRSLHR
ncbi:MAG: AraC family transcriptional regulator [Ferruginibacter sp.]